MSVYWGMLGMLIHSPHIMDTLQAGQSNFLYPPPPILQTPSTTGACPVLISTYYICTFACLSSYVKHSFCHSICSLYRGGHNNPSAKNRARFALSGLSFCGREKEALLRCTLTSLALYCMQYKRCYILPPSPNCQLVL